MKKIVAATAILMATCLVFGEPPVPQKPVPAQPADTLPPSKARVELPEMDFDFGFAPQGTSSLVHNFKIKNMGEEILDIKGVRPGCGCTAAPLKKKLLEPKEETETQVIFNSRGYTKATSKSVRIETNDPTKPNLSIRFSANFDTTVWYDASKGARAKAEPAIIDFGAGDLIKETMTAKIQNLSEEKMNLKIISYQSEFIELPKLSGTTLSGKGNVTLTAKLIKGFDKAQPLKSSITIAGVNAAGEELTRFTIPLTSGPGGETH